MILLVDAPNIKSGGGLEHLINFLNQSHLFLAQEDKIILYAKKQVCEKVKSDKIEFKSPFYYELPTFLIFIFNIFFQKLYLKRDKYSVVFAPGGVFLGKATNLVSIPQNMLPYDKKERGKFPLIYQIKFRMLFLLQKHTLEKSESVIFLSKYAQEIISSCLKIRKSKVISHGISLQNNFKIITRSNNFIFKLLYVSPFLPYKNHELVILSVIHLIKKGLKIELHLAGQGFDTIFNNCKEISDGYPEIIFHGNLNRDELNKLYNEADLFIFASTCENLPITLLEAMSFGLPIVCSNLKIFKEILGDRENVFFNLNGIEDISKKIEHSYTSNSFRKHQSKTNYKLSKKYTIYNSVNHTIDFLKKNC